MFLRLHKIESKSEPGHEPVLGVEPVGVVHEPGAVHVPARAKLNHFI